MTSQFLHWKVGDPVVCVDATEGAYKSPYKLRVREVYTIAAIEVGNFYDYVAGHWRDGIGVKLSELPMHSEHFYCSSRFRKVVTRPTSIAVFEALLNPSEEDIFHELEAEEFDYQDCTSILGARS